MIMSVLAYMAAYTSITLNFMQENYSLLYQGVTQEGIHYQACKSLWWDYVTETGELVILIFGIHLSYASRNARTQFHVSYDCISFNSYLLSSLDIYFNSKK
jgi:G protein-coupled receptor 158